MAASSAGFGAAVSDADPAANNARMRACKARPTAPPADAPKLSACLAAKSAMRCTSGRKVIWSGRKVAMGVLNDACAACAACADPGETGRAKAYAATAGPLELMRLIISETPCQNEKTILILSDEGEQVVSGHG